MTKLFAVAATFWVIISLPMWVLARTFWYGSDVGFPPFLSGRYLDDAFIFYAPLALCLIAWIKGKAVAQNR